MPIRITRSDRSRHLTGSPEKRLDQAPDGTLWVALSDHDRVKFFYSKDRGNTWSYSSSYIDTDEWHVMPSFFIDADGYAHVAYTRWEDRQQSVRYHRGRPRGNGWEWSRETIWPGSNVGIDCDVVAFRQGAGWVAFVGFSQPRSEKYQIARIRISASGRLDVETEKMGPTGWWVEQPLVSLEFAHTGDGRTPTPAPHLFAFSASRTDTAPAVLHKAQYESGSWVWQTPVTITTANIDNRALTSVFDGSRLLMAWAKENDGQIYVSEWDGTTVTARNPPVPPAGVTHLHGITLSVDPISKDVYLVWHSDGPVYWSRLTRPANTWAAWAQVATRSGTGDGRTHLVKHPRSDTVDLVFSTGDDPYTLYYQQVAVLVRNPAPPAWISPENGTRSDLASGFTARWAHSAVRAGDAQQSYQLRRVLGATTQYWNAGSQAWSSTAVWNASAIQEVAFPAGSWVNGNTYSASVRTRSTAGGESDWSTPVLLISTSAPVIVVTSPTGLHYDESTPLVEWTYTSSDPQRDYEVRIIPVDVNPDPADPASDTSGVVASSTARSYRVQEPLVPNLPFRAWVRATSTVGVTSAWAYSEFSLAVEPPVGPIVEAVDEVFYETGVPRARLTVIGQTNMLGHTQALGSEGWEPDANCTWTAQPEDISGQLYEGMKLTALAPGPLRARTVPGEPPPTPEGEPLRTSPLDFPVRPGDTYSALASFKSPGAARAARVLLRWYDADDGSGALITETIGDQVVTDTILYVPATVVDTAPEGAMLCRVVVEVLGAEATDEVHYVSRLVFQPGIVTVFQPGGYDGRQTFRVERSLDGGTTWETAVPRVTPDYWQRVVVRDRAVPFGQDIKYRAYSDVDVGGSSLLVSQVGDVATIRIDSDQWAIRDLTSDTAESLIYITNLDETDTDAAVVHRPAGRFYPIVDSDGEQAAEGELEVYVPPAQVDSMRDLFARPRVMLLQSPLGRQQYIRLLQRSRKPTDWAARIVNLSYVEVDG